MRNKFLEKYIGLEFLFGGRDKKGIDCIGLVAKYLTDQGYQLEFAPECSIEWMEQADPKFWLKLVKSYGEPIELKDLEENDILYFFWKNEIHAGVYIGENKFLHIFEGTSSKISHLDKSCKERICAIMRPSKTKKKTLPPAGRSFWQGVATAVGYVVGGLVGFYLGGVAGAAYGAILGGSLMYSLFAPEPEGLDDPAYAQSPKYRFGDLRLTRSNEIPLPLIYGLNRVSGNRIYHRMTDDNKTAYQLIGLSEGPIESITDVEINEENITEFSGTKATSYLGTSTQNVDTIATEDSEKICYGLRYLAYIACTFYASAKLGSLPNKVTAIVTGMKIQTWDTTLSSWTNSYSYSNNPAACIRDYLIRARERGGAGLSSSNLNEDSFGEIYDYCSGQVSDGAGGFENRFELNFVIDVKKSILDNLSDMVSSFGGYIIVTGATIKLGVKKSATSVQSFTDGTDGNKANIKLDSFNYAYIPKDNQINKVSVQYVDIDQRDTKPIATVDDFADQDERGIVEKIFPFFSIGRMSQALRMAWQILYDLKVNPITCNFVSDITAMHIEPGDVCKITHFLPGWTDKQILIASIQEKENNEYDIEAVSYNSSIYNDRYGSGVQTYDYGSPLNIYGAPVDITGLEVTSDGVNLVFIWDLPGDIIDIPVRSYELREGVDWDSATVIASVSPDTVSYRQPIAVSGTRTFLIKSKSIYGKYSDTPGEDSITITKVAGKNIILTNYLWTQIAQAGGTAGAGCQTLYTTGYSSSYYRKAIGVQTNTTWEELETASKTWEEIESENYEWDTPTLGTEVEFEFDEIDLGQTYTAIATSIIANYAGTSTDVTIEWRYGTSPGLAGAYATFTPGEYTYRYIQFNIKITNSDPISPSYLDDLRFIIDVFDVTERGKDVTVATPAGGTVTFDEAFSATPAITVTTQGSSAYFPIVTAKSASAFTVKLYDKDGTQQAGTIDWISRGWREPD